MRMVQKFGGTSLAEPRLLRRAAAIAAQAAQNGQVAVVVSAQGDTTDRLIAQAAEVSPGPAARELDTLLSAGEQMSAALLAMTLAARGTAARSLVGWQAGIHTDGGFGGARITDIDPSRVLAAMEGGVIPVVAGFQGVSAGEITTLGRGGSDTTAVALAIALGADVCRIYTDVDGVYDRDPRRDPAARRYARIGYGDMLALARSGAQVLHPRCVELARAHGLPLEVRSTFTDAPGTLVT